jgi:hypothetical protein
MGRQWAMAKQHAFFTSKKDSYLKAALQHHYEPFLVALSQKKWIQTLTQQSLTADSLQKTILRWTTLQYI